MKKRAIIMTLSFALVSLLFIQCAKDDSPSTGDTGNVTIRITDAPADDASVKGTFITVSEIKIDGKSLDGFQKQTFELSALRNGNARTLINGQVRAGNYSKVTLVLDLAADASGNAPGCYVLDNANVKHDLRASAAQSVELDLQKSMNVGANSQSTLIIDFDLRKSIARGNTTVTQSSYSFVSSAELKNSLRIAAEESTGHLKGKVQGSLMGSKKVIIYAYKKGTFDAAAEPQPKGTGQIRFSGAVTSSLVDEDGNYQLSFLEQGEYEVILASYDQEGSGRLQFSSLLSVSSLTSGIIPSGVAIGAKASVTMNINITGLLS
jgi:cytoskeletal protein CcmA (bactofilin family)